MLNEQSLENMLRDYMQNIVLLGDGCNKQDQYDYVDKISKILSKQILKLQKEN